MSRIVAFAVLPALAAGAIALSATPAVAAPAAASAHPMSIYCTYTARVTFKVLREPDVGGGTTGRTITKGTPVQASIRTVDGPGGPFRFLAGGGYGRAADLVTPRCTD